MAAKHVVVTGNTRGLGRALTAEFLGLGHRVSGCGRSESPDPAFAAPLSSRLDYSTLDLSDTDAVASWADRLRSDHGAPDLLVNNAALINRNAPLWEVPAREFARLMDVNVDGVFHVIRAFLPAMIERGGGVIVNISSGWGRSTAAAVAPYCASKWAVEGLTGALAQELPSGLAAVALNPGIIDTGMLRSCFGSGAAAHEKPEQWARRAATFMLALGPSDNGRSLDIG